MTKNEFVKAVASASLGALTQRQVAACMEAMSIALVDVVKAQDDVKLCNAVIISGVLKEAHEARNPATGGTVKVPAKIAPKAKFAKNFKEAINA